MKLIKNLSLVALSVILVTGCSNARKTIFDESSPSMRSLLSGAETNATYGPKAVGKQEALDHNGFAHPGENVFRELANPTLTLYVEPHRTEEGTYVPGTVLPFKLYKQVEFALPGEL